MLGLGRRRNVAILLSFAAALLVAALPAFGKEESFRIHQAFLGEPPTATLFLEAFDGRGSLPAPIDGRDLQVFCEGRRLPVTSLTPFEKSDEGTAFIFLVDISKSLREPQLNLMKEALSRFIEEMGPRDEAALLSFGDAVVLVEDFTDQRRRLLARVEGLRLTDMTTHLHHGLIRVQEMARRLDEGLPRRKVAIVLSDGKNEAVGGETKEEVLESFRREGLPLFALGFYAPPLEPMRPHLEQLRQFAQVSGGDYFPPDGPSVGEILKELQKRLNLVWRADVDLSSLTHDGREVDIEARLQRKGGILSDRIRLRLWAGGASAFSTEGKASEREGTRELHAAPVPVEGPFPWLWVLLLAFLFALLLLFLRRRQASFVPDADRSVREPRRLKLDIFREGRRQESFSLSLEERLTLGRASDNDVCLKGDPSISARHCELYLLKGDLFVNDLKATNGTYVNDQRIADAVPVRSGDVIRLGRTTLRIQRSGEEGPIS